MQLITRLDFDGLVSATMVLEMERVERVNFANPADIETGRLPFEFRVGDAVAHLPFISHSGLWFHNRDFEDIHPTKLKKVRGKWAHAPSCANLVYSFYNDSKLERYIDLVQIADRIGSANLTREDIVNPEGWMRLNYTLDPRFQVDHNYGMLILEGMKTGKNVDELLDHEVVINRLSRYNEDSERYIKVLRENTKMDGKIIYTDFRDVIDPPSGNRYSAFIEYPEGNVHVRVQNHRDPMKLLVSVSKSIFDKSLNVHIGDLMSQYSGGGVDGAGTCPVSVHKADARIPEILDALRG